MAPRSLPKEFIGKTGKFDYKNFDYAKFNSLSVSVRKRIVTDSIKTIQDFLRTNKFTEETREAGQILFAIDKANPSLNLGVYGRLLMSRIKHDSDPYLNEAMLNHLKQNDPYTFDLFARDDGWELYTVPNGKGGFLNVEDMFDNRKRYRDPETQTIEKEPEIKGADSDTRNADTPAEPTEGVLSNAPLDTASPTETPPGVLSNPPAKLPEATNTSNESSIAETPASAKKRTNIHEPIDDTENLELISSISRNPEDTYRYDYRNRVGDTGINKEDLPAFLTEKGGSLPKEGIVMEDIPIVPEAEKSAAASPSPEAIHEAMADAVAKDKNIPKDDTVVVPPEAAVEEAAKGTADAKAVTESTEAKAAEKTEDKATPETAEKGALTGEPKGFLGKVGDHFKRNWGKYLGGIGATVWAINDLASDNSKIKTPFTGSDVTIETNNPSGNQPRVKSLDQREGAYMPERLLRFRQDTQEPFVNNTNVTADTGYIPVSEELPVQQQEQQSQVVNVPVPVNNATADYVRAAYNSYIPSDAGRAYQKAIYGDPLELERNRLQQKWRDFVMRSGQSPAELVQRGLMPYDALQYV